MNPLDPPCASIGESDPDRLPGLSIVLPCLNEEDSLAPVLRDARAAGRRAAAEYEIIVIDDGSQDATAVIAAAETDVRVIRHETNRGRGAAVRSGLAAARMPYVLITDADGQCDLRQIDRLAPLLQRADIVVGRRRSPRRPWMRRVADRGWYRSLQRVAPLPVHDPDCSLALLRRDVLDGIVLASDGRALGAELLIKCVRAGARVTEVSVDCEPRRAGGRPHRRSCARLSPNGDLVALRQALAPSPRAP